MGVLVSFVYLAISLIYICKKKWVSPSCIFCLEWGIIFFLAQLRLYSLYKVSYTTWLIYLIGGIAFVTGTQFGTKYRIKQIDGLLKKQDLECYLMTKKTFTIMLMVVMVLYSIDFINAIQLMLQGISLADIRAAHFGITDIEGYKSIFNSGLLTYSNYAKNALYTIIVAICIFSFFDKMKTKWLLCAFFLVIIKSFSTGSRFDFAFFFLELLVCFSMKKNYLNNFFSKIKRKVIVFAIIAIIAIVIITFIRGGKTVDIGKTVYTYLCSGVVLGDKHIQSVDTSGFYSYPYAGFYGVWSLILPIITKLGVAYPYKYIATNKIVMTGQDWLSVGDNLYSNAFLTPFYYLYADMRIIGVIAGMLLLGYFYEYSYRDIYIKEYESSTVFYLIIISMLFKTIQSYPFSGEINILTIVIVVLLRMRISIKIWRR